MHRFEQQDRSFVALIDGAFAKAAARGGSHVACRPGCSQCCVGVFAVGPADVLRIEGGFRALADTDPDRYARVRERARSSWARLSEHFPGDPSTGRLALDPETGTEADGFAHFGNEEPCPALDPSTGRCDLYEARPHTCRIFGVPLPAEEGFGVCELCFTEASADKVAVAALAPEFATTPHALDQEAIAAGGAPGLTILSYVISR